MKSKKHSSHTLFLLLSAVGGLSAGELTNLIGIIIQNRMNIYTLLTSQIGTHPLLTASPAGYPLMKATENAAAKLRS